ncbi:MAG: MAPEG family protein [Alphaproteobacteria bacterium]|nr:MAPEG family protein [Alphaproteobacteria bacterium]
MTITLIAASFLGLLFVYLSYNVAKNRGRAKVSVGDGGDEQLQNAIRAHGNFAEYTPFALVLFGLLETAGANQILVLVLASVFVASRYAHGLTFGKFEGFNPFRYWGTVGTWLTILTASVVGVLEGYSLI